MNAETIFLQILVSDFRNHACKAIDAYREALILCARINRRGSADYEKFCEKASIKRFYYPKSPFADFHYKDIPNPSDIIQNIEYFAEVFILDMRNTFEQPKPKTELTPKEYVSLFTQLRKYSIEEYEDALKIILQVQKGGDDVNRKFWKAAGLKFEPELDIVSKPNIHGVPPIMAIIHHIGRSELELPTESASHVDFWSIVEDLHADRPIVGKGFTA